MTIASSKTLEQTIAAIEALDLEPIKFKATRGDDGYGWSPEYAEQMAQSYKRYLILHAKYPEQTLAPDQDTDRFWHMHILDTRKYAADCDAIFGEFLHHFPYLGLRGEDDAHALEVAFEKMQALLALEFGTARHPEGAVRAEAFCTVDGTNKAAFCTVDTAKQAAFCTVETKKQAAFCTVDKAANKMAFCTVDTAKHAAFCTVETKKQAAFCTVDKAANKAAFCTVDTAKHAAFCTVETCTAKA